MVNVFLLIIREHYTTAYYAFSTEEKAVALMERAIIKQFGDGDLVKKSLSKCLKNRYFDSQEEGITKDEDRKWLLRIYPLLLDKETLYYE